MRSVAIVLSCTLLAITAACDVRELEEPTPSLPGLLPTETAGAYLVHRLPPAPPVADDRPSDTEAVRETQLAVRSGDGRLLAVWQLPEGHRLGTVSDSVSPDGRWLVSFSGELPDPHLMESMTAALSLHVWDLLGNSEVFSTTVLHPGIREDLRRQAEALAAESSDPEALAEASWEEPRSDAESRSASEVLHGYAEEVVEAFRAGIGTVRWSPDGRRLAFVGALDGPSGDLYVLETETWSSIRVSEEPAHVIRLAWSPDGRWILHEGAHAMSRASGSAMGRDTTISASQGSGSRRVWSGSQLGAWVHQWPDAWLTDGAAIVHGEGHGCGICSVLRIDAATGMSLTLAGGMEGVDLAVEPAYAHAALAARDFRSGDSAQTEADGVFLLALDGSGSEQVHDQACDVARWGADGLPYVWLPSHSAKRCSTIAFGSDNRRQTIGNPEAMQHVSVSPGGRWRVLYGESGWRLFDRESITQSERIESTSETGEAAAWHPVEAVAWHPDETRMYWLANARLWTSELPDGEPRVIGQYDALAAQSPTLDLAWLER